MLFIYWIINYYKLFLFKTFFDVHIWLPLILFLIVAASLTASLTFHIHDVVVVVLGLEPTTSRL